MMLPEEDHEQPKPNPSVLNPSINNNNNSDQTVLNDVAVNSVGGVDGVVKQEQLEDEPDDVMLEKEGGDVAGVVVEQVKTLENQKSFLLGPNSSVEDETGTEEEKMEFIKELERFYKERGLDFKPPRFYGETLNLLKLWRSVIRNGGYEQVTAGKVWRYIGESFNPPKTCTTVSWTFRCFYEKILLEYEKYKMTIGDLPYSDTLFAEPASIAKQPIISQTPGPGRARRDAAARAMQGWHSQRLLGNGEVGDPIIKDRTPSTTVRRDKRDIGLLKRKKPSPVERDVKLSHMKALKPQLDSPVVDVGLPADWVKINVQRTKDCFEVYALVPGLLREEILLEYEKYKMTIGDLPYSDTLFAEPASIAKQPIISQTPGPGRARRDAAARAMQGWHSQRLLGNGEVGDPIIKDRTPSTTVRRDKRDIGLLKRKKPSPVERDVKLSHMKALKPQLDSPVVDVGLPADWVKINVQRTKDCFEVYALVPGLLREEVRVQSDPAGRLVISGQPEQLDNPWGVSPFKKVVSLPSRIDPHQTSAVVTLHGQLFVRVPFEQPAM